MARIDHARRAAAREFGRPVDDVAFVEFRGADHPWAHRSVIALVEERRRSGQCALVAVDESGGCLVFPNDSAGVEPVAAERVALLNRLLASEAVTLPRALPPKDLARTIRAFLKGLGGTVLSRRLFELEERGIEQWLRRGADGDARLFEASCEDAAVERDALGEWTLRFQYLSPTGSIERWTVRGDAERIREAAFELAAPPRTFQIPYG